MKRDIKFIQRLLLDKLEEIDDFVDFVIKKF